ncbi:LCP family protein [Bacillus sp. CECT 9360]|uniref:LCP family protein n=1 Tax=Bacillus sp. CECT 9360 TaxID=2845821 RepID=UPI001E2C99BB|nr:LCP family protein [Bacillus sp. CECT 9360]CAH0344865.1 Polyisoprenyl-teichoic acid--peptidoglycan teichoic acid transferase TagV [Bacillus sp. CECT 9360]
MPYNSNKESTTRRVIIRKRKKRKRKRFIRLLLLVSIISIVGYTGFFIFNTYSAISNSYADGREKSNLRDQQVKVSNDPFSVLILGIEDYSDEHDRGRSDTIMVATFNPKNQTMKLVSIPRDTLVDIPGKQNQDKINHAYAFGGRDETIETVEGFLDIPIDYFAMVNFKGFQKIIDEVGGVNVEVPFSFNDIDRDWNRYYFKKGEQNLNGDEALVYARMRKKDPQGDFGRNFRQRQIVTGLVDKVASPKIITKIDNISEVVGENIETNMSIGEALAFRNKYENFNKSKIDQLEIKGEDDYMNGVYYFKPDEEEVELLKVELKKHLELLSEDASGTSEDSTESDDTKEDAELQ